MKIYGIRDFGALPDGSVCTKAIQRAIDLCEKGGVVSVPRGEFRSGALFLKSDMTLRLEEGARLVGSGRTEDFPIMGYPYEGLDQLCYASLINTDGAPHRNITIEGRGVIDANGKQMFDEQLNNKNAKRGRAVCIRNTEGVAIRGVEIRQSPAWCLHLIYCKNVLIDDVKIHSKYDEHGNKYEMHNCDGIDIDSCSGVKIINSLISSQDDCIALKSGRDNEGRRVGIPTENVQIENCRFVSGFGVAVGSEMSGGVENVFVKNCEFENVHSIASIKPPRGRGAYVKNVHYENCSLVNRSDEYGDTKWFRGALYIDGFYGVDNPNTDAADIIDDGTPEVDGIYFKDITVYTTAGNAIYICGLPERPFRNIFLENVKARGKHGMIVKNVENFHKVNVDVKSCGSSFDQSEVKLLDGIFFESQKTGETIIKSLDVDRLLAPAAYSAGAITDTSKYYGGWEAYNYRGYKGKGISGHSLGHWMSAAASMYSVTGDAEIKEKLDYAVAKLAEYQKLNGHGFVGGFSGTEFESMLKGTLEVSAFDLNGYWVPWYSLHKIYQGLIDAYELAGNEQALEVACSFADWAKNVTDLMSDEKFNQMLECEFGGMNEVMAKLYGITGRKDYLDLAVRFTQPSIIGPLSEDKDELQGKHANTQIPKVIGAAEVFEQNGGGEEYKEAARFFYDTVVNNRSYVIGGNSNYEHFGTVDEEVLGTQTCETCNTYNMMKLTEHLYAWEHDAAYMDYYEKALFNHILASQDPQSGMKTYFMATKQGHFKVYSTLEDSFWCCVGSGMENPSRYTRNIYYKDGDNFYVNQFIASKAEWKEKGLTISQHTNYPFENKTVISIDKGSADAAINIRIPSWLADDAKITHVNGAQAQEPITVEATGKAYYYIIKRRWTEGDKIIVTLPMDLHTYTARDSKNKVSFMYGPVVLAGALGTDNFPKTDLVSDHTSLDSAEAIAVPDIVVADKNPKTFITASDLSKLEFNMRTNGSIIKLVPYFNLHHERYSLYWNLYGEDEEVEKDEFSLSLDAATIDTVRTGEQQPEVDHAMRSSGSHSGYLNAAAMSWRDAYGEGSYFSYEMKVNSKEDNYVMAVYWGSDAEFTHNGVSCTRDFSIYVDDIAVGTKTLSNNSPNNLIYEFYKIPSDIVKGKNKATVKFMPNGADKAAGGVFEVRITNDIVRF